MIRFLTLLKSRILSCSSNLSYKNWLCFALVAVCVIADTNILFHEKSPSPHLLPRLLIDLIAILFILFFGLWLSLCRGIASKLLLLLLTTFIVLDCVYAHILGRITSVSLLLVGAVLQPGSELRNGYNGYIITAIILIVLFSFLLSSRQVFQAPTKRYFGWFALALFGVQIFLIFPNARGEHLTIKYRGLSTLPWVGYPGWGLKSTLPRDPLVHQLHSLPAAVGDFLSIVVIELIPGVLPVPRAEKKTPAFLVNSPHSNSSVKTIVLVVGESSAAKHWSLYGAKNGDTPELDALYAEHRINYLAKAHSPADMTRIAVLPQISMWSPNNLEADHTYENIIELAKDRGYKTFWFSGTNDFGIWAGDSGHIAATADILRSNGSLDHGKSDLLPDPTAHHPHISDNEAFALAEKVLDDPAEKKLIIIHQEGSHWPYESDKVDKKALPSASPYDLTIHKTERSLAHLIKRLDEASERQSSLLVYASDHGEVVTGKYSGHYNMMFKGNDYIIPVILAGSEHDKASKLAQDLRASNGWYSTNMNKYLVLNALGYSFSKSSIGVDAQTDNIIAADENLYDWINYYQPSL